MKLPPLSHRIYKTPLHHKIKLAMPIGNRHNDTLKQIQLRHFYQTGQKARIRKQGIDSIFLGPGLTAQMDRTIAEATVCRVQRLNPFWRGWASVLNCYCNNVRMRRKQGQTQNRCKRCTTLKRLVGRERFERSTIALKVRCSTN